MEWTLDQDRLYQNPLLTPEGQQEIRALCKVHRMAIPSLTADSFMLAPFWKATREMRAALEADFIAVARACAAVGIQMVVVPLVDNGRLEDPLQEDAVVDFMLAHADLFRGLGLRIIFESDFTPAELARFIDRLDPEVFGINYDIGNSAGIGYDPVEELAAYGKRVLNVHVKDRMLNGTTVPLTTGAAQFDKVFAELGKLNYVGNFILQTARAADGDHAGVIGRYHAMTRNWITCSSASLTAA